MAENENKSVAQADAPVAETVTVVGVSFREAGKIYYFDPRRLNFSIDFIEKYGIISIVYM